MICLPKCVYPLFGHFASDIPALWSPLKKIKNKRKAVEGARANSRTSVLVVVAILEAISLRRIMSILQRVVMENTMAETLS